MEGVEWDEHREKKQRGGKEGKKEVENESEEMFIRAILRELYWDLHWFLNTPEIEAHQKQAKVLTCEIEISCLCEGF